MSESERMVRLWTRVWLVVRMRARSLTLAFLVVAMFLVVMLIDGKGEALVEIFETGVRLFTITLPLLVSDVCRDLRRGTRELWLQKPISPIAFFLARFGEHLLAVTLAVIVPIVCLGLIEAVGNPEFSGAELLGGVISAGLWSLLIVSLGFGISAWLPGRERLATLLVLVLTFAVQIRVVLDIGRSAIPLVQPEIRPSQWLLLPIWAVPDVAGFRQSALGNLLWILGYCAIWILIAVGGVHRATRSPVTARSA